MRELLKDKTGKVPILTFGFVFLLLMMTFLTIEMGSTYENYDYCMDVLQRSCNSAVEANIDDSYRADKVLLLKTADAEADFHRFVAPQRILCKRFSTKSRISRFQCAG